MRPTMRFVPVNGEETQVAATAFRIRDASDPPASAARLTVIVEDPDSDLWDKSVRGKGGSGQKTICATEPLRHISN